MVYGWKFPIGVDPKTGRISTNDLQTDIRQSIKILLETRKNERLGRPDYGSKVDTYMFENIDKTLMADIKYDITQLISYWENRIDALGIDITPVEDDGFLRINIIYRIKELDQTDEFLYEMPLK